MKKGLDYFSMDVDFFEDEKIQFVSSKYGVNGEMVAIRLLTRIYRNGYYIQWDNDAALLFARLTGNAVSAQLASKIVTELVRRGFFDKRIYDTLHILTSHGIQARYLKACERRKMVEIDERLLLVNLNDYKNARMLYINSPGNKKCIHHVDISEENVDISNQNADILSQSKVKESKVKESSSREDNNHQPLLPVDKSNEDVAAVCTAFEKEIGLLTAGISEALLDLVDDCGCATVLNAIRESALSGVHNFNYMKAIAVRLKAQGIDSEYNRVRQQETTKKVKVYDEACSRCHGSGWYECNGAMRNCDCWHEEVRKI